jgi:ectoine hydroxylase-related dioxygenase (phytanoyl-CoA dioxygenase family)
LISIISHLLGTTVTSYNTNNTITTDPILSASSTLDIGPGMSAQSLHRDDFIWQQRHTAQATYEVGADMGLGILVAGIDTTVENGATVFVPGSHLWDHERLPKENEAVAAELKVGEAFLFLSSTVHGGGMNRTNKSRAVHGFFYCRSYIRPEVALPYPIWTVRVPWLTIL